MEEIRELNFTITVTSADVGDPPVSTSLACEITLEENDVDMANGVFSMAAAARSLIDLAHKNTVNAPNPERGAKIFNLAMEHAFGGTANVVEVPRP